MLIAQRGGDSGSARQTRRRKSMTARRFVAFVMAALLGAGMNASLSARVFAQEQQQMKDDLEQLEKDVHTGFDRSSLTEQQKAQFRDDLKELRRARKNHEPMAALRAARSLRSVLDSGGFKPEDQEKIKRDLQQIREAREDRLGGAMVFPDAVAARS
jgi:Spy/CpxP family protein refolding chaperone